MHQMFLDELSHPVVIASHHEITALNKAAKNLFPTLSEGSSIEKLEAMMPAQRGEVTVKGISYHYHRVAQAQEEMFTLEPNPDHCFSPQQFNQVVSAMRESATAVDLVVEELGKREENQKEVNRLNHALVKVTRLLQNYDVLEDKEFKIPLETLDLAGLMRSLCGEVASVLEGYTLDYHHIPPSLLVRGNVSYLRKALLGLIANAAVKSKQISLEVKEKGGYGVITLTDYRNQPLDRPLINLLTGTRSSATPRLHEGAGLGLLVVQRYFTAMDCLLWAEERKEGGLVMQISIPKANKKNKDVQSPIQGSLDLSGGWSDLLLELSPVLDDSYYDQKGQE